MKQSMLILVGLVIAIAGGFFLWKYNQPIEFVQTEQLKEETPIMLYRESGFVAWKKQYDADYAQASSDEIGLPNNVYVKTAEDGRGYVVLPDNSTITLDKNTEILISYEPKKVSIKQLLGSTYHRVESLVAGKEYEVRTPGTLAAVRGTKFGVTYDKKRRKTTVSVTEHKVAIVPIEKMDEIATSTGKSVDAGMTAVLEDAPEATTTPEAPAKPRAAMVVQKTDRMIEEKKWIDENKPLDKELDVRKEERREYMKEFIKKMKEEKERRSTSTAPVKPAEETKERVRTIERVIKEIEVERPDLKPEISKPVSETETETETVKTGTVAPSIGSTGETTETRTSNTLQTTEITLKSFDVSKEFLSPEEEKFTNDFYREYETYLYVDASIAICDRIGGSSGADIVERLEKFANSAGYFLPKKTELLSLGNDIIASCKDGSIRNRVGEFQGRFDVAYPFSQ